MFGVDLGTTCVRVAQYVENEAIVFPIYCDPPVQTSKIVRFKGTRMCIGDDIEAEIFNRNNQVTFGVMELIGREKDSSYLENLSFWPYQVVSKGSYLCIMCTVDKRPVFLTPEKILSFILKVVKYRTGRICKDTEPSFVLSVPGCCSYKYRRAVLNAARKAKMNVASMVGDTSAIAYATLPRWKQKYSLIIDIGGGSSTVSLVEYKEEDNELVVLSTIGDCYVGGAFVDFAIYRACCTHFNNAKLRPMRRAERAYLRASCEDAKRQLSDEFSSIRVPVPNVRTECEIDKNVILASLKHWFKNVSDMITNCLLYLSNNEIIDTLNIEAFVLGGMSHMRRIREEVQTALEIFPHIHTTYESETRHLVCKGAALLAMSREDFSGNVCSLREFAPELGVRDITKRIVPVISPPACVPTTGLAYFSVNRDEHNNEVIVEVYERKRELVNEFCYIGRMILTFPDTNLNTTYVKITFDISENYELVVYAEEEVMNLDWNIAISREEGPELKRGQHREYLEVIEDHNYYDLMVSLQRQNRRLTEEEAEASKNAAAIPIEPPEEDAVWWPSTSFVTVDQETTSGRAPDAENTSTPSINQTSDSYSVGSSEYNIVLPSSPIANLCFSIIIAPDPDDSCSPGLTQHSSSQPTELPEDSVRFPSTSNVQQNTTISRASSSENRSTQTMKQKPSEECVYTQTTSMEHPESVSYRGAELDSNTIQSWRQPHVSPPTASTQREGTPTSVTEEVSYTRRTEMRPGYYQVHATNQLGLSYPDDTVSPSTYMEHQIIYTRREETRPAYQQCSAQVQTDFPDYVAAAEEQLQMARESGYDPYQDMQLVPYDQGSAFRELPWRDEYTLDTEELFNALGYYTQEELHIPVNGGFLIYPPTYRLVGTRPLYPQQQMPIYQAVTQVPPAGYYATPVPFLGQYGLPVQQIQVVAPQLQYTVADPELMMNRPPVTQPLPPLTITEPRYFPSHVLGTEGVATGPAMAYSLSRSPQHQYPAHAPNPLTASVRGRGSLLMTSYPGANSSRGVRGVRETGRHNGNEQEPAPHGPRRYARRYYNAPDGGDGRNKFQRKS